MGNNYGVANKNNVIQGDKYRFTVLSPRLIRLEYNELGVFEDHLTQNILYRNMPAIEFSYVDKGNFLEIKTDYFYLKYKKDKPFYGGKINASRYLQVKLINSDRIWYYGHPEVRNYGSPAYSLDDNKGELKFKKGLYSGDGFVTLDDSNSNIIDENNNLIVREGNPIDIYLFTYFHDFNACLKDYYMITGYPAFLPRYAFGNWWYKNEDYSEKDINKLLDNFREKQIPLSVLLLNQGWHNKIYNGKTYHTGYSFNKLLFDDPKKFIDNLHNHNIHLGLNVNTSDGIKPYEDNFSIIANNLGYGSDEIIPFNVWDNNFINNYFNYLINPLELLGVDFYWIDDDDKNQLKNLWRLVDFHYRKINFNNKRSMVLSRNHMICTHRYPILYSGKTIVSWNTLKILPFLNSSATNIGVSYWSHDIGGYYKGTEDGELYTRYVQFGVFSPILKFGSDNGKYFKREPWKWSMKTYSIAKDYLNLRHQLIPYLYTEAYMYHAYGVPIITPVYYKTPKLYDDINYRNEYFLGQEFLISPIVNKKDSLINRSIHRFYLPEGIWYDFKSGKKFIGNKNYVSFYREEDYPVFVKQGAIIPLGIKENINDTSIPTDIEIHIFPGESNSYILYEDDGITNQYRNGKYLKTLIEYNYNENNYNLLVKPIEGDFNVASFNRNYKFVFRNTKFIENVSASFNNIKIDIKTYIKGTNFIVEVYNMPTVGQLSINCNGDDIEIDNLRIINEDIESIISDLQIKTELKEQIDSIFFSNISIKRKRVKIRKLNNKGLEKRFVEMFLKLLEYVEQI